MVRVLIIEDSAPQAVQLGTLLEREGFTPEIVGEAYAALARLHRSELPAFDVVISDVRMPGLSGYEFCRQVKLDPALRHTPVLLVSGDSQASDLVDSIACGADGFLTKPYRPTQLLKSVRDCASNRPTPAGDVRRTPVEMFLDACGITADSSRDEIFALLVSTVEQSLATNRELIRSRAELSATTEKIEHYAEQLEGKVRLSEDRNALLMEHARSAILVLDTEGVVLEANREATKLLARAEEDMIGVRLDAFIDDNEEKFELALADLLDRGELRLHNTRLRRPDGKELWVDTAAACVRVGDQNLIHLIWSNVTERVQLEAQLRQSQKMEAVGQLTGGLAHDFNNLLGVIIGNLEFLVEMDLADAKIFAEDALSAALRGGKLIQQLLAFSRRQPLQSTRLQIDTILPELTTMLQRTLGGNVLVERHVVGAIDAVRVDQSQLESAILNLAVNARDAMQEGGTLAIEVANARIDATYAAQHAGATPGHYVMISVSDSGAGMTPEILSRVFDPFFTTKGQGGTGLGLSMVFGFVKQSGGHVAIYSEVGHGTTVRLYLPVDAQEPEIDGTNDASSADESGKGGRGTVLLVDDEAKLRAIAARQIEDLGYEVVTAASGEAALALLHGGTHADLLLTDIVMPGGMDGRQLATEVRAAFPAMKLIFSSGFTEARISESIGTTFGSLILSKPYRKAELAQRLRQAFEAS